MTGWPKGPFPEKWSFASVEKRLAGAWEVAARAEAWARLVGSGAEVLGPDDDAFVRVFRGDAAALEGAKITVWDHAAANAQIVPGAKVALPTDEVFDALVALGVAGPHHGIGNRTIVRFLLQARPMASFSVAVAGEDFLALDMKAKNEESATLLAGRLPHVAPTIAREGLRERLLAGTRLSLDWSPPH